MTEAICDECETVGHCSKNGCIPKVPLLVQCARSGQMDSRQIASHDMAGELHLRRVMAQQIGRDITEPQDRRERVLHKFNEQADRDDFESTNRGAISNLVRHALILAALAMFGIAGWYFSH